MTIAAAYLISDGVVFGADSSTTVQVNTPQGPGVVQLLTHSQKVFEVGQNSRFGICTWGAGSIGTISHRAIIAQLSDRINDGTTVSEAADLLVAIADPLVRREGIEGVEFVGYYLGGWNLADHMPECIRLDFRRSGFYKEPLQMGLCSFSGNPIFFARVFRGFDPTLKTNLLRDLKKSLSGNLPEGFDFDALFNGVFDQVTQPLITSGFRDLPIREAIDFVYSYLHITVKAEKFKYGPPTCGGPIEIGFVSNDRPFRWVRHKHFDSAIIEQEGEYGF